MAPVTRNKASRAPVALAVSTRAPPTTTTMSSSSPSTMLMYRPTSEIMVDQRLSFDLMRIVITTNISHIFYHREVLGRHYKWNSNTTIDPADPTTLTYDDFVSAADSNKRNRGKPVGWERTPDLYNFKILSRGQHAAVDKVLDWLETGVKDALEKEYLSKLELCFHRDESDDPNPASDSNIIESYAMVFTYADEGGVAQIRNENSTAGNSIILQDARHDAKFLLDSVEDELKSRMKYQTPLPARVRITMNVTFNDKCPDDYRPKGFIPSEKPNARLAGLGQGASTLSMATKFHSLSVHLPPEWSTLEESANSQRISSQSNRIMENIEAPTDPPAGSSRTVSHESQNSDIRAGVPAGIAKDHSKPVSQGSDKIVNRAHTQGSGTQPKVMAMLGRMGVSRNPNTDTQDTVILKQPSTQNFESNLKVVQTPRHRQLNIHPRRYKDFVCKRIDKAPKQHQIDSDESVMGSEVMCECGVAADEMNLMRCNICGNLQHMQCYGYHDQKAKNVELVCYSCLLRDEPTVLSTLKTCCIHRKVLYYLQETGGESLEEIAKVLDCDRDTTRSILGELKKFVRGPPRSARNSNSQRTAQPKYMLVDNPEKIRESYFNPDLHIEDYLEISDAASRATLTHSPSLDIESMQHTPLLKKLNTTMHYRRAPVDGSSTQGTPSTVQRHTPDTSQLPDSALSGVFSSRGRKRGNLAALENDATKRFKEWSTRSPNVADSTHRY